MEETMRVGTSLLIVFSLAFIPASFAGTPSDVNFSESVYASGLSGITGLAWAADGSNTLFVTQKAGTIRVIRNGALQATAFASLTVFTNSECGLIGIVTDPNYASNKFVYVFATINNTTQQI